MKYLVFAFFLGIAIVGFLGAALALRVLVDLIRRGPGAADDAFENGASISVWWKGKSKYPKWLRR